MSVREAEFDPPVVEAWLDARSGALAVDVGANQGRLASSLAERFERVLAFEPCEESFVWLARKADTHPNLYARFEAVSSHVGTIRLAEQSEHMLSGQLSTPGDGGSEWELPLKDGGGGWGEVVGVREVVSTTLDEIARTEGGDPSFVKIDVEGHEVEVVEGGMDVFARARPEFYIEIHNRTLGEQIRHLLSPLYPDMVRLQHPFYKESDFGFVNHYWLVSSP